ncbi:MAG: DUF1993 family protein [Hyphomonadaceae bacterium]
MALTLYDATVGHYKQQVGALANVLAKGAEHFKGDKAALADILETRLFPDMLPFSFQVVSIAHHSVGAIAGAKAGVFTPPPRTYDGDYKGLQDLLANTLATLDAVKPEDVNALSGKDVVFKVGDMQMPYLAEGFFISMSLPNFFYHCTTAYDILRSKGVPLGKRDFMGRPQLKQQ